MTPHSVADDTLGVSLIIISVNDLSLLFVVSLQECWAAVCHILAQSTQSDVAQFSWVLSRVACVWGSNL